MPSTKALGDAAETQALNHLQAQGLHLLGRNYRLPGRGAAELDLVMRASDGTVVFVEVRARRSPRFGGAAASIGWAKRQRLVRAAQHFVLRWPQCPPMRFDVVLIGPEGLQWLQGAFEPAWD